MEKQLKTEMKMNRNSKNDITLIKHSEISLQPNSEKIDTDILLSQIRENWKRKCN